MGPARLASTASASDNRVPGGRLDLEQLAALAAVGDAGSVAEAARRTRVPRTTLQRRIDALEAELGIALLHRSPTGVALTAAALRLAERGRALTDDLRALGAATREEHDVAGTLRMAYPCGLHPALLCLALRTLMGVLPQVRFRALPGPHAEIPADADVCLHIGPQPPPGPFVARTIARVPVRLLAGQPYVRAHGLPERVEDLTSHTLLHWSNDAVPPTLPLVTGGSVPVTPRVVTPDLHFLHQAARDGVGIVFAVDGGVAEPPGVDALVPVLPEVVGTRIAVWLLVPEVARPSPRIQEALRTILDLASMAVAQFP